MAKEKIHLVIPDSHSLPGKNNNRAIWLGRLINDIKPTAVIHIGDGADLPSLCSYDKGSRAAVGRTYRADINSHLDFQDKLWSTVKKAKKRLPHRVYHIGNHEQRINVALDTHHHLEGTISMDDLELDAFYNKVVPYDGGSPGINEIDGIYYAHYFVSGLMGRPVGGEHVATSIIAKMRNSCTQGHSHLLDFSIKPTVSGKPMMACVVGVFQDYHSDWAGFSNSMWWQGCVVKRHVDDGVYDPMFISMDALRKEYES